MKPRPFLIAFLLSPTMVLAQGPVFRKWFSLIAPPLLAVLLVLFWIWFSHWVAKIREWPRLKQYVEYCEKKNVHMSRVRSALLEAGWSSDDADELLKNYSWTEQ